jgi:ceramide glucosyltransferase
MMCILVLYKPYDMIADTMWYELFLLIGLLFFFASLVPIGLFVLLYMKNRKEPNLKSAYKIAVIVPCKGLGENLEENLTAICNQDYGEFQVIFVVDSSDDPAYPVIEKIIHKTGNARIEFSEKIPEASGKIGALIAGIHNAGSVDVYVFADSDIKPHRQWLASLVTGLSDEKVGATSGFRWFFPRDRTTALISVWNMTSMASLFHPMSNCAWGGSTAIKKELFDRLPIESKWRKGFSDDLILTEVVKKAGYIIEFVPSCILESPAETDIKKFMHWGTQQFTWVRWYNPALWFFSFIGMAVLQFIMLLGVILLSMGYWIPGLLMVSPLVFEMMFGLVGFLTLRSLMKYPREKFGSAAPYFLLMPYINILFAYNLLLSSVKKEIKWSGKYYTKKDALKRI